MRLSICVGLSLDPLVYLSSALANFSDTGHSPTQNAARAVWCWEAVMLDLVGRLERGESGVTVGNTGGAILRPWSQLSTVTIPGAGTVRAG